MTINLSGVRPDFDQLTRALLAKLNTQDAWKDVYPAGTGQILTEFAAGIGALGQHSIESLFVETFLSTARRDSSVYTITRMLGARVSRKLSPGVVVQLTRAGNLSQPYVIRKWTQFGGGSSNFVAVEPIVFGVGQAVVFATLYAGEVRSISFSSDGSDFQEYKVTGARPFSVSDQHLEVLVNSISFTPVHNGLWNYGTADRVVNDTTDGQGSAFFLFGNDTYGTAPNPGDTVTFTYLDNIGPNADAVPVNTELKSSVSGVSCITTYAMNGGANEKDSSFYRVMAPYIYSSAGQASTVKQYEALAMTYPGIVDCVFQFQRDLDPYNYRYMNVAYATILVDQMEGSIWSSELEAPDPPSFTVHNDGGVLIPGTYSYRITSVNEVGESEASPASSYAMPSPGSLLIQWPHVDNATKYRVYGRFAGNEYLMVEVTPDPTLDVVYYLDDGKIQPGTGAAPSVNTTRASFWTFRNWFESRKHASTRIIQRQPVAAYVDITVTVHVKPTVTDLDGLRVRIYESIFKLMKPKTGSLGRRLSVSDIDTACKVPSLLDERTTDVDYVEILSPEDDVVPYPTGFVSLNSVSIAIQYTNRSERF